MPDHPKIREQWASYLDQIEEMDREVGVILEDLKNKNLLKNTIVIFIGNNGRCDIRGKGYLYEPGIKTPMIVWGEGVQHAVVNDLVSTLDISATIWDCGGCELPDVLMGKPFLNLAKGTFVGGNKYIYSARDNWDEIVDCMRSIVTPRFKYIRNYVTDKGWDCHQQYLDFHRPAIHVMRKLHQEQALTPEQELFMANHKPEEELYDLVNDPHELNNLAGNPKFERDLQTMRDHMNEWQKKHVDLGLQDLSTRKVDAKGEVREYVKKVHPKEWKEIEKGELCVKYKKYVNESQSHKK